MTEPSRPHPAASATQPSPHLLPAPTAGTVPESAPVTGVPVTIANGDSVVDIAPLGAGLRRYERGGTSLVESYGDDTIAPGAAGLLLAPWGNRVRDGRWVLDGEVQQLDITEVARNNASHGLLRNTGYTVEEETASSALLSAEIYPQHGFPFRMTHRVLYSLSTSGHLTVEQTLTNHSRRSAPAALGAHPYLRLGEQDPALLKLTVEAESLLEADSRLLPVGKGPVDPQRTLRSRPLEGYSTDTCFTDLPTESGSGVHGAERIVSASLEDEGGRTVSLWADAEHVRYLHVFVTAGLTGQRRSVAIEPMTAPADAFNSGDGLVWLEPGDSLKMRWGITSEL